MNIIVISFLALIIVIAVLLIIFGLVLIAIGLVLELKLELLEYQTPEIKQTKQNKQLEKDLAKTIKFLDKMKKYNLEE